MIITPKVITLKPSIEERVALNVVINMCNEMYSLIGGTQDENKPMGMYLVNPDTGEVIMDVDVDVLRAMCNTFAQVEEWQVEK